MLLVFLSAIFSSLINSNGAVLDPALFLLPSPPLLSGSNISPETRWKISDTSRVTREADPDTINQKQSTVTEKSESMESAETFWPGLRTPAYGIRGIHIPLTFSIHGTYGNSGYGSHSSSVVGSSYASISTGDSYGNYGKSALAGSSYGSYPGIRVFGGGSKPGWSGWGNGKWGHYGKG
ncbi:unnamed protein product [Diatraea saccharalis]|uniref:Uncharacterized protein n=1 Tax=Diatraea saccharalis TaxID=40085 RepID=A0A9N9RFQ7_9NEOP|nr:unnamed protein product [Diatraea saccharalis]